MRQISIRELHERTGEWVRRAAGYGELWITDRGHVIAKLVAHAAADGKPYFARRKPSAAFRRLAERGKLRRGTDSTTLISEDRSRRVP
jgi:antitoxin (DNA-binding transcriptional repressor) of toxin-antitoxin stability system